MLFTELFTVSCFVIYCFGDFVWVRVFFGVGLVSDLCCFSFGVEWLLILFFWGLFCYCGLRVDVVVWLFVCLFLLFARILVVC